MVGVQGQSEELRVESDRVPRKERRMTGTAALPHLIHNEHQGVLAVEQ